MEETYLLSNLMWETNVLRFMKGILRKLSYQGSLLLGWETLASADALQNVFLPRVALIRKLLVLRQMLLFSHILQLLGFPFHFAVFLNLTTGSFLDRWPRANRLI